MYSIAVRGDRCVANRAVFVTVIVRLLDWPRSTFYGLVKGVVGILNQNCDIVDAVAVLLDVLRAGMIRRHRRRQYEIDISLPHQITRHFAVTRLKSHIPGPRKPERLAVIKLRLLCIADVKLDVMYFFKA